MAGALSLAFACLALACLACTIVWRSELRSRVLLRTIFPDYVTTHLADGVKVPPRNFECVTVFFSDIVRFTDYASSLGPMKIVDLLDRLYAEFDRLAEKHELFKVETIGDSYMVCGALVGGQETTHAAKVAAFAVEAMSAAKATPIDTENTSLGNVQIRGGFHCGPVVGGVVGRSTPRFCLFGDTINVAARMEQNSEPGRILVSDAAAQLLRSQSCNPNLFSRGHVFVKGKGPMLLWWLEPNDEPVTPHVEYSPRRINRQVWRRSFESMPNASPTSWGSHCSTPLSWRRSCNSSP